MSRDLRSALYQAARLLGWVNAARRGPAGVARRAVRVNAHRTTGKATARLLRSIRMG